MNFDGKLIQGSNLVFSLLREQFSWNIVLLLITDYKFLYLGNFEFSRGPLRNLREKYC